MIFTLSWLFYPLYLHLDLSYPLSSSFTPLKSPLSLPLTISHPHPPHSLIILCPQVQYHNAVLCKLRPGLPVLALYGKQKQLRRVGIYEAFCRKTAAVLLATDIAARGLDIPAVHWVVHLDCSEDVETYIHR